MNAISPQNLARNESGGSIGSRSFVRHMQLRASAKQPTVMSRPPKEPAVSRDDGKPRYMQPLKRTVKLSEESSLEPNKTFSNRPRKSLDTSNC
jgi:hypothetical protein